MAQVPGAAGTRSGLRLGQSGASLNLGGVDLHASALWTLIALELGLLYGLRHYFRRHHGG